MDNWNASKERVDVWIVRYASFLPDKYWGISKMGAHKRAEVLGQGVKVQLFFLTSEQMYWFRKAGLAQELVMLGGGQKDADHLVKQVARLASGAVPAVLLPQARDFRVHQKGLMELGA